jgi:hypothetical protein
MKPSASATNAPRVWPEARENPFIVDLVVCGRGQGVVVMVPERVRERPPNPVRVAVDVQLPPAQLVAPVREATAPRGPVVELCDVHEPSAQLAEPWCVVVRPEAVVVDEFVEHARPAQVVVAAWVAPRGPVDETVRVAAEASNAESRASTSAAGRMSVFFMTVPSDRSLGERRCTQLDHEV